MGKIFGLTLPVKEENVGREISKFLETDSNSLEHFNKELMAHLAHLDVNNKEDVADLLEVIDNFRQFLSLYDIQLEYIFNNIQSIKSATQEGGKNE